MGKFPLLINRKYCIIPASKYISTCIDSIPDSISISEKDFPLICLALLLALILIIVKYLINHL